MLALQGLVSHQVNLFEAGLEQKRVDVERRLDERISHLYGLCNTSKMLSQTDKQLASGGHRHAISNTSSLTATTRAPTLQTSHSARRLEQFGNQSNYSTFGASHDSLPLCGSVRLWDPPSTQTGCEISWLSTSRTEVDGDVMFSSASIPPLNTLRHQAQPNGSDTNPDVLRHRVEAIHQMEKSAVVGQHRKDLDFHIRKIHEIEQQGLSLSETSISDSSLAHDAHSIHFEAHPCVSVPPLNLDSNRSIMFNHSILSSQSPHNVSEHQNSVLLPVQKEETKVRGVDVTQLMHQCNLREELEAERLKVDALHLEVLATRQDLNGERQRASLREQEFMQEIAVLRMENVPTQTNCASCKNYQIKMDGLETSLAEATREHELVMDNCAELANLKLQLAHEREQRTLQERACDTANAEKEEYKLKFEKLKTEHQKQQYSLVELEKKIVGLELQRASNVEVDKQRQDMCDNQSALLRKLEAELEQAQRDLVIEREFAVRLLLQIQQLQLDVKREKERSSSQEIQLRDAFEEIKQRKDTSTTTRFPFPPADICQQTRSVFRKFQGKIDAQAQKKKKDEHAVLKQVEVVLAEAVENIEQTKVQAAGGLNCVSH